VRFQKVISTILHPIVIPTIGVMLYFLVSPLNFNRIQKFAVLLLIFIFTYIVPLLALLLLKKLNIIQSFRLKKINERRIPLLLMIFIFYGIANGISYLKAFQDISLLFYATSLGLLITYILLFVKIKTSIHLLSLGISCGFFMLLTIIDNQSYLLVIVINLLMAGFLASARLKLKMHTNREVYLGFLIGVLSIFSIYAML
jgi:hypothetical protein